MELIKGAPVSAKIKEEVGAMLEKINGPAPKLAIIRVGENPDDMSYERGAVKKMDAFGLRSQCYTFPADITDEAFKKEFTAINEDPDVSGILLLRPLPKQICEKDIEAMIDPKKDLDGISPVNIAKVFSGDSTGFAPCTAEAVIEVLKAYDISMEDMIPRENTVITMTKLGYIKRMTVDNFRSQNRGGRGIKGMQTLDDDYIEELMMTTTHHYVMFFTNTGRVYRLKAYEIPEAGRTARGTAIINLLQLMPGERITAVIPISKFEEGHYLMMATRKGLVKKTPIQDYANVRKVGLAAIALRDDDELIEVKATDDKKDIILVTKYGQCIRFKETDVRSTGRVSMGVRGINLLDGDEVVAMQLNTQGYYLLVVSENGMGKRTSISEFTCQNRGGKGVKCYKITEKTGNVIGAKAVNEENEIMMITTEGIIIRLQCADISILGRITSGVKLINLSKGVTVASFAKVREKEEDKENQQTAEEPVNEANDEVQESTEE